MAMSRSSSADSGRSRVMTMSSTLKRAHCMADGQLTPPSSPGAVRRALPRRKLQISKLLRRPKTVTKDTALTSHRVESTVTSHVSDVREPFPPFLPASPVNSEYSLTSISRVSPVPQPELRRMSTSCDLRSIAARQSMLKVTPVSTPLLPSPIAQGGPEVDQSYFRFHNPRSLPSCEGDYTSYEDLHLLSCYYDGSKPGSMDEIEKALEEDGCMSQGSLVSEDGGSDTTEIEMPKTPPAQISRSTTCSDEGNWLASDQSHEERLRRFKSRCYQVVQHPMSDTRNKQGGDNQIVCDYNCRQV